VEDFCIILAENLIIFIVDMFMFVGVMFYLTLMLKNSVDSGSRFYAVAQLVEALRYKSKSRGFHSRWGSLRFFIDLVLGSSRSLTEMSTRDLPWENLNPLGAPGPYLRPVQG
jgi:hypothetical protein